MNNKTLYTDDVSSLDNLESLVEQWHNSKSIITLREFLGMTEKEYNNWLLPPEA
ncbi:MAG: hypothetical protein AB7V16_07215 [Vulcanibacillus sp.]